MKVLVVGFGSVGSRHAANAKALGHEVFIYDPLKTEEEIKARFAGATVVTNPEWPGWDVVDAYVIATPTAIHDASWSFARSKPTLFEKPLALNGSLARECPTSQLVRVGYNLRFHPAYRYVLDAAQHLGALLSATFFIHCDKSTWPGKNYENMLVEGSHEVDLALWMLGPATVQGVVQNGGDCWTLLLAHDSGCASTVILNGLNKAGYRRGATIVGENGAATMTWNGSELAWQWAAVRTGAKAVTGRTDPTDTYLAELKEFLELAARRDMSGAGVGATIEEATAVIDVCDEAARL